MDIVPLLKTNQFGTVTPVGQHQSGGNTGNPVAS